MGINEHEDGHEEAYGKERVKRRLFEFMLYELWQEQSRPPVDS